MRLAGVLAVVATCCVVVFTSGAGAAPSGCVQSGLTFTCTYNYTGAEQSFVVPAGVTSVRVDAVGAPGGSNGLAVGGSGGTASATLSVTPGSTLFVEVGGAGTDGGGGVLSAPGGWNGGGNGGVGLNDTGGGGGGASDLRTVSCGGTCPGDAGSLGSRLVVAAGGGGRGATGSTSAGGPPGDAGSAGQNASNDANSDEGGRGGGAGTSSSGGAFGAGGVSTGTTNGDDGTAGDLGVGGNGGAQVEGGAGGGGGLYGGGGGGGGSSSTTPTPREAGGGGGGGGSSLVPAGGTTGVAASGTAPSVTITYTLTITPQPPPTPQPPAAPPTVSITKPANGAKLLPGQQILVSYTCIEGANGPGIASCSGPVASGQKLKAGKPGMHSFTVTAKSGDGLSTSRTASYKVLAPSKKKGIAAGLTLTYKKSGKRKPKSISFEGVIAASGGAPKTALPFKNVCLGLPSTCTGQSVSGEFTLRATPKPFTLKALKRRISEHSSSGTLTMKQSGLSLSYTLQRAWVKKISTPSLAAHSKVVVLTVVYESLKLKNCSPSTSC